MLAENFLANEAIWLLEVNSKIASAVRKFAAWARGEIEVRVRGARGVAPK